MKLYSNYAEMERKKRKTKMYRQHEYKMNHFNGDFTAKSIHAKKINGKKML